MTVEFEVNGHMVTIDVPEHWLLADVLRNQMDFTGVHLACEYGVCGACTVLMDGEPVRSCLTLAVQAAGRRITTVEGLASEGQLNVVQQAFIEHHALQCGFCTPGFVVTASYLVNQNREMTREQIREALSGNLCRCTGYQKIVDAVEEALRRHQATDPTAEDN
ncbi:MAG: (2Fe-2S)-binding protein [Sulfobacillus benefaciens]|uniref:(2Fe-2S)-binding protein n=1 Tax=Sulfobacillus benefaciens TaxID=453960 RepID=A0A2T2XF20_9FIRM|nr:MAG: (2Fe-2S)-binding protein [Sulfobacillus benefaciens]